MTHLFCFGLGYSAALVCEKLARAGWIVSGTATTAQGAERISQRGYRGLTYDGTGPSPQIRTALQDATHILLSIPPGAGGDPAYLHHGADIASANSVRWIGYFSTVGVYGDAGGGWVDEETPATPASERGKRRLHAEEQWRALGRTSAKSVTVFRLPGIYGPGRSAIEDVLSGTARRIIKPGQVFNRIHVEDIAAAVISAMGKSAPDRVYNVTDDEPSPPQDVVSHAAHLLDRDLPPALDFATADLSPMARSFYGESKRVSNARLKAELLPRLTYPTYREGLAAILRERKI